MSGCGVETKALAALIPELYNRLFAVEEKMETLLQGAGSRPKETKEAKHLAFVLASKGESSKSSKGSKAFGSKILGALGMASSPKGPQGRGQCFNDVTSPAPKYVSEERLGHGCGPGRELWSTEKCGDINRWTFLEEAFPSEEEVVCAALDVDEGNDAKSPGKDSGISGVSYTVDRTSHGSEGISSRKVEPEGPSMEAQQTEATPRLLPSLKAGMNKEEMVAVSPGRAKRRNSLRDYSRAKISDMSESMLDVHTMEYYKWGEARCLNPKWGRLCLTYLDITSIFTNL
eukprot:Skav219328  [mRNA]  locus=scaffold1957:405976:408773:- [translate_table: standard]